ncbi:MAG: sulfatase-like hydrolase/transferase [Burkholderiales bacterium]|nr:sulfatase-like hydrolase/transferase [Burkholderiales bacterium]
MHLGLWLLFFGVGLAIWQRPIFASGLNVAMLLLIVLVSNAKFASLREPFLLSDFRFFKALLRHPRLYLPFFGVVPAIGSAVIFGIFCVFALRSEASMLSQIDIIGFLWCCLLAASAGVALLWLGMRRLLPVTLDPADDLQTWGLLGSFVRYWQEERANSPNEIIKRLPDVFCVQSQARISHDLPHIVSIQCESFFDARRVFKGVHAEVLKNFDALTKMASRAGRLNVPAWGANTVRTEFAFLSGIAPTALGVHRFNPYRKLARQGLPTIASELKKLGYRTVCVHPFSAKFYDRDKVFPVLGFDEFIDIAAFSADENSGPFIGDLAVAAKVRSLLGAATEPLFIFVITMENHGPLHLERVAKGDEDRLYTSAPPAGYEEFTIYLRHLQNTDAMLGEIHAAITGTARGGWLCAYGDHVPILPGVYEANGFADGRTDYVVVGPAGAAIAEHDHDVAPENLALDLLRDAGLAERFR